MGHFALLKARTIAVAAALASASGAALFLSGLLPAAAQATPPKTGPEPILAYLVPQDFSDCSNANVQGDGSSVPGGAISILPNSDGSISLKVGITGTPNTTYNFYLKCVRQLGTIVTHDEGAGEASFTIPPNTVGAVYAFDVYPAGAPPGNKFQSTQVKK